MVDHYRPEVEKLEDRLDELEKAVFERPDADARPARSSSEKRDVVVAAAHRHAAARRRSARLARRDFVDISTEMSFRFRDVYDHLVRIADDATMFQDRITGILDAHLSNVSNRLNEVMKVLTVVSTIFMPLTLLAGLWGMNVAAAAVSRRRRGAVLVAVRHHGRRSSSSMLGVLPPQALDLSHGGQDHAPSRRISPTRSPPAKSSSGRPRSSRSWSRTRSTPARAALVDSRRARRQEAGPRRGRRRGDGAGGCAAGDRAARDQQDPPRRRSRRRS